MKLLLDEMFPAALAEQLRTRGHDVVSIHDRDYRRLEGAADEEIFAVAAVEERAHVTGNVRDFRRLEGEALARGERAPRFVFTTNRRFPRGDPATIGRLVLAISALLEQAPPASSIFLKPP